MKLIYQVKSLVAVELVKSFNGEIYERRIRKIIRNLKEVMDDLDKVEAGAYGYKSAAPRARKVLMEATKKLRDLR
jgi:hypothetical protein